MLTTLFNRVATRTVAIASLALACHSVGATPISWDATADYSLQKATNVNGVWSYGWSSTPLSGSFNVFSTQHNTGTLKRWDSGSSTALIGKAIGGGYNVQSTRAANGTVMLHPGSGGQFGVLRFVAPEAGRYEVNSQFWASDTGPTSDAHIISGGTDYYSTLVTNADPYGASDLGWKGILQLNAGQFVDFAVGYGSNATWFSDSTGISAIITKLDPVPQVPEPSGLLLMASGLSLVAFVRRRQRN